MLSAAIASPASLMFLAGGLAKLRHERPFRYQLINLGFRRLANRTVVRTLALFELACTAAGVLVGIYGVLAVAPMLTALGVFTAVLIVRRPDSCGCGPIEMSWAAAAMRNAALAGLLVASSLAG